MFRMLFSVSVIIAGVFLSACSVLHTPQPVDYQALEQTAAVHITETFAAMPTATETFTPVPTNTPEPTATAIPTATEVTEELFISRPLEIPTEVPAEPTATAYFPDKAEFYASLPSPNQFLPNQRFNLTWQLKNTGTSTWSGKYRFFYSDGVQLADQSSYEITDIIEPGGILTVTLPATAPGAEGTYKTTWTLMNPDGIPFYYINYITIVGDQTFITEEPSLRPSQTPSSLDWMCSDPERSRIQGDGCFEFCGFENVRQLESVGSACYVNGERITYGQ